MRAGGIVAFPSNGIFGLFGEIDCVEAADRILEAKNRPTDRKLVQVCLPEYARDFANFGRVHFTERSIVAVWREVHALGLILPAATTAPYNLVVPATVHSASVLPIWTEYTPLRTLLEHLRNLGGPALVGTSANKMGEATLWQFTALRADFEACVDPVIEANVGAWADLDWEEFSSELDRLRQTSPPTPPIEV
ncbi:MAG: Sua5/YciO/YrdC/YwlC family protein [Dehalococcoidia bacterium]